MAVGGQRHALTILPPRKNSGTHYRGDGWAPGPVWTGVDKVSLLPPPKFELRTVQRIQKYVHSYNHCSNK